MANNTFFLSPGFYTQENDLSQRLATVSTSTGAITLSARKGPVGPNYVTSGNAYLSKYGYPDPTISPAHDCILAFLEQAPAYVNRVVNGAKYAGVTVLNGKDYNQNPESTQVAEFIEGSTQDMQEGAGARNYYTLSFSKYLVDGNVFSVLIGDGVNSLEVTQTFQDEGDSTFVDNDSAMVTIASTITNSLNSFFATSGWVAQAVYDVGTTENYRQIRVVSPEGGEVQFSNARVTSGSQQAIITVSDSGKLFDIFAYSPGSYASSTESDGVGFKIVDVDVGTQQQQTLRFDSSIKANNVFSANVNTSPVSRYVRTLSFSSELIVENSVSMTLNGRSISPVLFTSSNSYTFVLLQKAIKDIVSSSVGVGIDATNRTVTLTSFYPINLRNVTVTGGVSQATATISASNLITNVPFNQDNDSTLFAIGLAIAQQQIGSPASADVAANTLAITSLGGGFFPIRITDVTITGGASQVNTAVTANGIEFSGSLVEGNIVNCYVNGNAVDPVYYDQNMQTTLGTLAASINKELAEELVSINDSVVGNSTLARTVTIRSVYATADYTIEGAKLTGGSSRPNLSVTETLARVNPSDQFTLEVYTRENTSTPQERFRVSLTDQQDGYGNQLNIASVVNKLNLSDFVRIYQPSTSSLNKLYPFLNDEGRWVVTDSIVWLAKGDDGSLVTSSNIIAGWREFENAEKYGIRILINGGYSTPSVQQAINALALKRKDCFAVLDMPSASQKTPTLAVNYRKYTLNINSSYSAIYTPDLLIQDEYSGIQRYIPPSGHVAARFAYTDNNYATWFSPAGLDRGQVSNILGLRHEYSQEDRDLMSPSQVNTIIYKRERYAIYDDQTLQSHSSATSNINVRRLLILISVTMATGYDYKVFDPNDSFLAFQLIQLAEGILRPIQEGRGLFRYAVVSDENNNTNDTIAAGGRIVDIYLDPTLPARGILLRSNIMKTGASFTEIVSA